jgi:hypothetical protein
MESLSKYDKSAGSDINKKRYAWHDYIRYWQYLKGYAFHLNKLVSYYYDVFLRLCSMLSEQEYRPTVSWEGSNMLHIALMAVEEILLRGEYSKGFAFLLLRPLLEDSILSLIDTTDKNYNGKYKDKEIRMKDPKNFMKNVFEVIEDEKILSLQSNVLNTIYGRLSYALHRLEGAYHNIEVWYLFNLCWNIIYEIKKKSSEDIDNFIDKLVSKDAIEIKNDI